jgi:DNA (cytosine-5)-methyltransferase 1
LNEPTHVDLFSGIGGFALAAQWAGFRTIAFCEIESYCRAVTIKHWPKVEHYNDVRKFCRRIYDCEYDEESGEAWCPRCDEEFGECECIGTDQFTDTVGFPDLITGGVPCQPASLIGERRGTSDERWLWPDTIRIMGELRPRFGVFENPTAILTLESGRAFNGIVSGLVALGYDLWWEVFPAYAVGAGHRRERVLIVASNSDCEGLEGHARNGKTSRQEKPDRSVTAPDLRSRKLETRKWYHQSGIQPVVNGIPGWLARHQLEAIGNAIVPQVAYEILRQIRKQITCRL